MPKLNWIELVWSWIGKNWTECDAAASSDAFTARAENLAVGRREAWQDGLYTKQKTFQTFHRKLCKSAGNMIKVKRFTDAWMFNRSYENSENLEMSQEMCQNWTKSWGWKIMALTTHLQRLECDVMWTRSWLVLHSASSLLIGHNKLHAGWSIFYAIKKQLIWILALWLATFGARSNFDENH